MVDLKFVPKKRGLFRHRTYDVAFKAEYVFINPTRIPQTMYLSFPLPAGAEKLEGFEFRLGEGTEPETYQPGVSGVATRAVVIPASGRITLHAAYQATAAGYSHVLTMDSDGQHPADLIPAFMQASRNRPEAMILGRPVFDASAPLLRVRGRRVSNWWTNLETLGAGVADSLYGFRVYPAQALAEVMRGQPWMRRFDFDTEAVVRLAWRGIKPVNLDAPVKYLTAAEGGVSHFRYGRDNLLLSWMHARLMVEFVLRLPVLAWRKARRLAPFQA